MRSCLTFYNTQCSQELQVTTLQIPLFGNPLACKNLFCGIFATYVSTFCNWLQKCDVVLVCIHVTLQYLQRAGQLYFIVEDLTETKLLYVLAFLFSVGNNMSIIVTHHLK